MKYMYLSHQSHRNILLLIAKIENGNHFRVIRLWNH